MKTMTWLIRREFWEHKGSFFWVPVTVGAIMSAIMAFMIALLASGNTFTGNVNHIPLGPLFAQMTDEKKTQLAGILGNDYMLVSLPIFMTLGFIVFFYCLNSLYEERRDRSILFWKSLPISDGMTVLSKLAMAAAVAPLIMIAVASATSLLVLLALCLGLAVNGINVFGMVLTTPGLYLAPLKLIGLMPVYLLWALPTIGWLMMVSAWARSKVFLWAVGVPALSLMLLLWADKMLDLPWNIFWYAKHIIGRILLGVIPGAWFPYAGIEQSRLFIQNPYRMGIPFNFTLSWAMLASPDLWLGVAAGMVMLVVATRLRRWREDA